MCLKTNTQILIYKRSLITRLHNTPDLNIGNSYIILYSHVKTGTFLLAFVQTLALFFKFNKLTPFYYTPI